MDDTAILETRVGESTILTLNRPEVMNSFNFALLRELRDRVERLQWDPVVRVVIITEQVIRHSAPGPTSRRGPHSVKMR